MGTLQKGSKSQSISRKEREKKEAITTVCKVSTFSFLQTPSLTSAIRLSGRDARQKERSQRPKFSNIKNINNKDVKLKDTNQRNANNPTQINK